MAGDPVAPADRSRRILVLGGSTEASALVARLGAVPELSVITSFAGRLATPTAPGGTVRIGGFGGVEGLKSWLRDEHIAAVVDATHPFTSQMPFHAQRACADQGVPRLRLRRPGWRIQAGDRWEEVADLGEAADKIVSLGARRVFLTTGRQQLEPFARLRDVWFLVRSIQPPDPMPLVNAEVVLDRGPFEESNEHALMTSHRIEAVVTKNSGGSAAAAKLAAARRLGLPVVMVTRPPTPAGPCAGTVDEAVRWCESTLGSGSGLRA
jgi:precorrin-6A/cobalt-precorrin-6A reductase